MNDATRVRFPIVIVTVLASMSLVSLVGIGRKDAAAAGAQSSAATVSAPTPGVSAHHGSGVTAPEALQELVDGNRRFVAGAPSHPSQDVARREALAAGQAPRAIILSCSDSRVPPELVFDRGLGEIFVVRVAGNVLGIATVASIEYAVEHLGCPLIVVMGHESCGAIKTALTVMPDDAGSAELGSLVGAIRPFVRDIKDAALADPFLTPAVKANVNGVCARLVKQSHIVAGHVAAGGVRIVPAMYHLKTGEVEFWDPAPVSVATRPAAH